MEGLPVPAVCFGAASVVVILLYMSDLLGPLEALAPMVVTLGAIAAMVCGIVRYRPAHAWTWWMIVSALVLFVAESAERTRLNTLGNLSASRSLLPDLLTFPGYVLFAIGLMGIGRARSCGRRHDLGVILDGLLGALGLFAIGSVVIINPLLAHHRAPLDVRVILSCYPAMSLFLVVVTLRIAASPGRRREPSFWFLLGAMCCTFVGDSVWMLAELHVLRWPVEVLAVPYLLAFTGGGLCLLHPSLPSLTRESWQGVTGRSWPRIALVGVSLLVPAVVTLDHQRESFGTRSVVFATILLLTVLAIARVVQALHAADSSEARLAFEALHDSLTGLPNRRLMMEYLSHVIDRREEDDTQVGVIFLDLDRFKLINDTLGHSRGDELLIRVADRLQSHVRPSDLVTRIGGDEFMVVLGSRVKVSEALGLAERLRTALRQPFDLAGIEFYVTASIGLAFTSNTTGLEEDPAEVLIRDADTAMYQAKDAGRDAVAVFDESMRTRVAERMQLEHDLRYAVERCQLHLVYQPVVKLPGGAPRSAEALVRWSHPQLGVVSPMRFIPLAEECGLIGEIGAWVLDEALRQLSEWRSNVPGLGSFCLAVNLSAAQLHDTDVVSQVSEALERHGLPGSALCLELTESAVMEDPVAAASILKRLRALGVRLAIDDFGTQYSSLAYLSRFPVDQLKIDRSFVASLRDESSADETLIAAIVAMARALGIETVAEGVETPAQARRIVDLGCDSAQGYLWSRPVRADQLVRAVWSVTRELAMPFGLV